MNYACCLLCKVTESLPDVDGITYCYDEMPSDMEGV